MPSPARPSRPPDQPRHIAVIMDGNGRWAARRGLARIHGHRRGVEVVKQLVPVFARQAQYLTLFAFSSENWKRPGAEVALLVELFAATLESEIRHLTDNQIRLRVIGEISGLPRRLQRKIASAVDHTRNHTALNLTIAINYGGRWDLTQACRQLATAAANGEMPPDSITAEAIESRLCTAGLPPPDLLIRTGGEQRLSNFLLWQLAYAELYFTDVYWPDFTETDCAEALAAYSSRQRRFGMTAQQVGGVVAKKDADAGGWGGCLRDGERFGGISEEAAAADGNGRAAGGNGQVGGDNRAGDGNGRMVDGGGWAAVDSEAGQTTGDGESGRNGHRHSADRRAAEHGGPAAKHGASGATRRRPARVARG